MPVQVLDHPLAHHLLTTLRDQSTAPDIFRQTAKKLTTLLILQATYRMRTSDRTVQTPVGATHGKVLDQQLAVVPVLRAGLGMLEAAVELFPEVAVGYIGLERHEDTAIARSYYSKFPKLAERYTLCLDPMLATGGSASQAISLMKTYGAEDVTMVCVVAAPEGIEHQGCGQGENA